MYNHDDTAAFLRAISVPSRGIGDTSLDKLMAQANAANLSIYQLVQTQSLDVGPRQRVALASFFEMIDQLSVQYQTDSSERIGNLIRTILEQSGYREYLLSGAVPNGEDKLESILELVNLSNEEDVELGEFLSKLSLSSDWDEADPDPQGQITLMTLHHAKGLEFKVVFLAGLEEGILPHFRSKTDDEIEEERRLCYVGITRGREAVILSGAQSRLFQGDLKVCTASRFLRELPPELVTQAGIKRSPSFPITTSLTSPSPTSETRASATYEVGEWVGHGQWGKGQILSIDGSGESAVLHISFSGMTKKLMAKYAPIRKLKEA